MHKPSEWGPGTGRRFAELLAEVWLVLVAAILWIAVVVTALVVGIRVLKLRARRRRIERLLYVLRLPSSLVPGSMNEMTKIIVSSVKMARADRRSPHWNG